MFGGVSKKKTKTTTFSNGSSIKASPSGDSEMDATQVSKPKRRKTFAIRHDSLGYSPHEHSDGGVKIPSLKYHADESEAYRAYKANQHYKYRGTFWNQGKRDIMIRYFNLAMIGIVQGTTAFFCNTLCRIMTDMKFKKVADVIASGNWIWGFFTYFFYQLAFTAWASSAVMIEPMSGGSGIPEVKCFLNGINLPRINNIKTGLCKVLGVIGSVSGGLPVGKEGPMVHSGAVVAAQISGGGLRDDRVKRDYVACGAAAGVCTAFSAPIGGFLFAFEEGASYWSQSLTFRTFFCSGCAIATLYAWNAVGASFGKVGLGKLFSFGHFVFEGMETSYSIWELVVFAFIGCMGGLIGAIFNNTNERLTRWRIKHVNFSKFRRFMEVMVVSSLVSIVMFGVPFIFHECEKIPDTTHMKGQEASLVETLVPFGCPDGEYHPIASLFFTDGNDAIKLLFHMRTHTFPIKALVLFFLCYISLATVTYGIAVPSGLFVPSLLAGAGFGRLIGDVAYKISPSHVSFTNTYSLMGAAAVLGGMARMTISLTVILLESTGNEQFVLPLMISLFCARIVGSLFNTDLYHIHIHLKPGVHFLDHELRAISGAHDLYAGHIMSKGVIFLRPVENVGTVYDILESCTHDCFPVVDTEDRDILYGTIGRRTLLALMQHGKYGFPATNAYPLQKSIIQNHISLHPDARYVPLLDYAKLEKEQSSDFTYKDLHIREEDRDLYVDIRPYCNTSPSTVLETTSVKRAYEIFRSLGLRILVVVNKYNQCVGTITRDDLLPESLAEDMITKGKTV